jgi:VanZ family protein
VIRRAAHIMAWFLVIAITALSFVPFWLRPETGVPHNFEHFAIFLVTGVAFGFAYERRPVLVMAGLVIFCATIEVGQLFIPDRHARLADFLVDALAACVGVVIVFLTVRVRPQNT